MKRHRSSGVGGAARDVEPERCYLNGIIFLGVIVVTDSSKSEKKKCTQEEIGDEGAHQKRVDGKTLPSRVFKEAWNMSHFATTKDPSLRKRHDT